MLDGEVRHQSQRLLQLKPKASPFPLCDIGGSSGASATLVTAAVASLSTALVVAALLPLPQCMSRLFLWCS